MNSYCFLMSGKTGINSFLLNSRGSIQQEYCRWKLKKILPAFMDSLTINSSQILAFHYQGLAFYVSALLLYVSVSSQPMWWSLFSRPYEHPLEEEVDK